MKQQVLTLSLLFLTSSVSLFSQEYKEMIQKRTHTVEEIKNSANEYFELHGKGKGSGYKHYKRWEYMAYQEMDSDGYLKPKNFYFEELKRVNQYENQRRDEFPSNDNWEELGPTYYNQTSGWNPGVGRITSLAYNPENHDEIYIGTPNGGIWKTLDKGESWTPLTDNFNNMEAYALAVDPSNPSTIYWGSVDGYIYRSTDSGATWETFTQLTSIGGILEIAVHPTNPDVIYAAMSNGGFWRTHDGGETAWENILEVGTTTDVQFNKENPNIVYLSGTKFHKVYVDNSEPTVTHNFGNHQKAIGLTAANSDKIYVLEENGAGGFNAFYVSDDGGDTFTELDHTGYNYLGYSTWADSAGGQAPRDMAIAVSQTDENEVHIAGILTWRSTNGGLGFQNTSDWIPGNAFEKNVGYCHADVDLIEMIDEELFVASDGGLFVAENTASINANYYKDLSTGLGIRQFYKFGISQTQNTVIAAGSQDNGGSVYHENTGQWKDWIGADGMESFVDKDNSNIIYGSIYYGQLYKSINGGNTSSGMPQVFQGDWVTPFEQDPIASNTIYGGGKTLYKTTNGAITWNPISPTFGDHITDIEVANTNNQIIFFGVNNTLYRSTNGGTTWEDIDGLNGRILDIAVHPTNPNKIAICIRDEEGIYVSNDGGDTWESYKKNLPDFNPTAVAWQDDEDNGLYVGMNYGIYFTSDYFEEWYPFNNNLPNVRIEELEINYVNQHIYVCTYGRGVWKSPLYDRWLSVENEKQLDKLKIYPNPASDKINLKWTEDTEVSIRVIDQRGRIVKYIKNVNLVDKYEVDISNLDKGMYFIKLSTSKGSHIEKIVKK
ncbi:VPS10 domain-containing protein [Aureivirga sp. CE67]|uniref:T9SS type A sorting domain-containing protein n=1 Tax=Aureivirga sp. CE67 TaxID=1788983 RepID=UPI0018CB15B8|nr:T9SS type A sorting domain-containing protein [Aureivirga sp. CE67]